MTSVKKEVCDKGVSVPRRVRVSAAIPFVAPSLFHPVFTRAVRNGLVVVTGASVTAVAAAAVPVVSVSSVISATTLEPVRIVPIKKIRKSLVKQMT